MKLTKRPDMWLNEGQQLASEAGDVIGYDIQGLPPGQSACLRHYQHEGWQLLVSLGDARSVSHGYFGTPDEALVFLEETLTA